MGRFAVQAAFAAYSIPAQSDKFYDLAGSLGFISTTLVSLVSSSNHYVVLYCWSDGRYHLLFSLDFHLPLPL
jgi:hypothetical protein